MVGVSSDSAETHDEWASKECLPFPLLSDVEQSVRQTYGVPRSFFGMLPGRLTFVIARDGRIHSIHGHQLRMRVHVDAVHRAVRALTSHQPALVRR